MNATNKTLTAKQLDALNDGSECIACASTANREGLGYGSLYWHETRLYRSRRGKFYRREFGGPGVRVNNQPWWMSRQEAVGWIVENAREIVSDFKFSREQAEAMVGAKRPPRTGGVT